MKNKKNKVKLIILSTLSFFLFLSFLLPLPLFASITGEVDDKILDQNSAFSESSGMIMETSIGEIVSLVIKAVLSLLGIIFVCLMIYAGYLWMTAGGDESKVDKARDIIKTAIIGIIIVVAAYSITYFVFKALAQANGG